jgi:hypothetical protein
MYRWGDPEYCEHLASYGFVVLSTDHEDAPPVGAMPPHAELSRVWDISALIDYAVQLTWLFRRGICHHAHRWSSTEFSRKSGLVRVRRDYEFMGGSSLVWQR